MAPSAKQDLSGTDLSRRLRDLEVVNHVARLASEDSLLLPMLQRIVDAVRESYGLDYVSLAFLDARRRVIHCEAVSSSFPSELMIGAEIDSESGIVGRTARQRKTNYVPDVQADPDYLGKNIGIRSELCIPIQHNLELIALLNIESKQLDGLADFVEPLETIAAQISGVIRNARIHQSLSQRAAILEMINRLSQGALDAHGLEQAMSNIAHFLRDRFDLVICLVLLLETHKPYLKVQARAGVSFGQDSPGTQWPLDRGILGRAARTGESQFVPDVSKDNDYIVGNEAVRSEFVVPIRCNGQFLGLLNLESANIELFSEFNRNAIESIALQLGSTINAVALNERLSSVNRELEQKSVLLEQSNLQLRAANTALERLSNLDGLTGIANRRRFDEALQNEWRRALRYQSTLAILMIDLDYFKAYNDGYGHVAGDDCLRRIAKTLQENLSRGVDLLARFGGEEFVALLPLSDANAACRCADRLLDFVRAEKIEHGFSRLGDKIMTVSIGVAAFVPSMTSELCTEHLIHRADRALYRAKAFGRNRVAVYDPDLDE